MTDKEHIAALEAALAAANAENKRWRERWMQAIRKLDEVERALRQARGKP